MLLISNFSRPIKTLVNHRNDRMQTSPGLNRWCRKSNLIRECDATNDWENPHDCISVGFTYNKKAKSDQPVNCWLLQDPGWGLEITNYLQ